jgi:DeoR family transcriptional regulator, fructose operon transcriptional repressor
LLTPERHRIILDVLQQSTVAKIQDFVEATSSSESTIRRDLSQLEQEKKLKRVHGGASLLTQKRDEPSISEKSTKSFKEKEEIAKRAADLICKGDCIYLDAGTTTAQMVNHIKEKNITVVTNGMTLLESLIDADIETYLVGGLVKKTTRALIGRGAMEGLAQYRFDKCFIGVNGIHLEHGYTTPDPEEAMVKKLAIQLSQQVYILADHTKFQEATFAKIADLNEATIITNSNENDYLIEYKRKTEIII